MNIVGLLAKINNAVTILNDLYLLVHEQGAPAEIVQKIADAHTALGASVPALNAPQVTPPLDPAQESPATTDSTPHQNNAPNP